MPGTIWHLHNTVRIMRFMDMAVFKFSAVFMATFRTHVINGVLTLAVGS